MAASTLRFVIIVALVVGGVLVINQAFPESPGDSVVLDGDGGAGPTESPSPSQSPSPSSRPQASPTIAGTQIHVVNAAGVDGLAGDTQAALVEQFGYEIAQEAATAPSIMANTTIYYRTRRDRVEAEYLANTRFFRKISDTIRVAVLPDGQDVDQSVQLTIYIGQDYAQAST